MDSILPDYDKEFKLPSKPSELLQLAMNSLKGCEDSDYYEVDMCNWHSPNGACSVCLAGSVIAQVGGFSHNVTVSPSHLSHENYNKLLALDELRSGDIRDAFMFFDVDFPVGILPKKVGIARYKDNPEEFKKNMNRLIEVLKTEGL